MTIPCKCIKPNVSFEKNIIPFCKECGRIVCKSEIEPETISKQEIFDEAVSFANCNNKRDFEDTKATFIGGAVWAMELMKKKLSLNDSKICYEFEGEGEEFWEECPGLMTIEHGGVKIWTDIDSEFQIKEGDKYTIKIYKTE